MTVNPSKRIRGRALQERRARWFHHSPLCMHCLDAVPPRISLAVELDHVISLEVGGRDDESNLQGLCWQCHQDKTAKDRGYVQRVIIGKDGWPAA